VAKYIDTSLDWADNNEKWNLKSLRVPKAQMPPI